MTRGEALPGRPVDFSHGDVDAHGPMPGAFDLFSAGVATGGALPGLYSANADNKAKYEAFKAQSGA